MQRLAEPVSTVRLIEMRVVVDEQRPERYLRVVTTEVTT
jgi:hypothetical protein